MGKPKCCDSSGLKRGPWTPEEDQKLITFIQEHGHGSWRTLPQKAGLQRCGKSCRLRWTNYLRPDIKRGKFSLQEEQTIIQLHALLGNRWSAIATHLPKRTDNEIKNYWNTHLKKRLAKMGIDPVTHKPKNTTFGSGDSDSSISHMAQWESARLEAEARLARESKLRQHQLGSSDWSVLPSTSSTSSTSARLLNKMGSSLAPLPLPCIDALKAWQGSSNMESPTSTLKFSEHGLTMSTSGFSEFTTLSDSCGGEGLQEIKERVDNADGVSMGVDHNSIWGTEPSAIDNGNFVKGFTNLLRGNSKGSTSSTSRGGDLNSNEDGSYCLEFNDNKNYWHEILDFMNCGSSGSHIF